MSDYEDLDEARSRYRRQRGRAARRAPLPTAYAIENEKLREQESARMLSELYPTPTPAPPPALPIAAGASEAATRDWSVVAVVLGCTAAAAVSGVMLWKGNQS